MDNNEKHLRSRIKDVKKSIASFKIKEYAKGEEEELVFLEKILEAYINNDNDECGRIIKNLTNIFSSK